MYRTLISIAWFKPLSITSPLIPSFAIWFLQCCLRRERPAGRQSVSACPFGSGLEFCAPKPLAVGELVAERGRSNGPPTANARLAASVLPGRSCRTDGVDDRATCACRRCSAKSGCWYWGVALRCTNLTLCDCDSQENNLGGGGQGADQPRSQLLQVGNRSSYS